MSNIINRISARLGGEHGHGHGHGNGHGLEHGLDDDQHGQENAQDRPRQGPRYGGDEDTPTPHGEREEKWSGMDERDSYGEQEMPQQETSRGTGEHTSEYGEQAMPQQETSRGVGEYSPRRRDRGETSVNDHLRSSTRDRYGNQQSTSYGSKNSNAESRQDGSYQV
ncbi:DEKNAAC102425 [Brettanomyces naardenensis]|uniref:DEKNAAC102425 n=1 Tax=Brettanomyces naardenensis TaxID=13370 RepID=A0A448YKF2_BRENA|nr:DEKNAAC102425 [Brettanomyces naardenensis]